MPTGSSTTYVIEVRRRIPEDAQLCDQGVLLYTVDATVRTGHDPIQVRSAHADSDQTTVNRCGPKYDAAFDLGTGEVATYEDPALKRNGAGHALILSGDVP